MKVKYGSKSCVISGSEVIVYDNKQERECPKVWDDTNYKTIRNDKAIHRVIIDNIRKNGHPEVNYGYVIGVNVDKIPKLDTKFGTHRLEENDYFNPMVGIE